LQSLTLSWLAAMRNYPAQCSWCKTRETYNANWHLCFRYCLMELSFAAEMNAHIWMMLLEKYSRARIIKGENKLKWNCWWNSIWTWKTLKVLGKAHLNQSILFWVKEDSIFSTRLSEQEIRVTFKATFLFQSAWMSEFLS
jgi:hypothetical protein